MSLKSVNINIVICETINVIAVFIYEMLITCKMLIVIFGYLSIFITYVVQKLNSHLPGISECDFIWK